VCRAVDGSLLEEDLVLSVVELAIGLCLAGWPLSYLRQALKRASEKESEWNVVLNCMSGMLYRGVGYPAWRWDVTRWLKPCGGLFLIPLISIYNP